MQVCEAWAWHNLRGSLYEKEYFLKILLRHFLIAKISPRAFEGAEEGEPSLASQ